MSLRYIEQYKKKLHKLQAYLDFAISVSNACGKQKNVPWKLVRSNQLFIRMTVNCMSFIRLLPFNQIFPVEYEFWDLYSVLSLARSFVETYLMMWYIGVDKISEEESRFRLEILTYHLNWEKYRFYKEFNAKAETLNEFEINFPIKKQEIETNPLFNTVIDKYKRKNILDGKEAKYLSNNEIIDRLPFETDELKPLYRWFSNHAHSFPFAFYSLTDERGSGNRNQVEVKYIDTTIDFVTKYLLIAIVDTINLFPFCVKSLDKNKLSLIQSEFITYSQNLPS